ncbi:MAG: RagB/SusD family nutrient uptake outer membrane protein [Chitinophagaceae bacterium]|nr:RagB/SusD family nutrient uptake outer membrane protein [Chitinophagaceae bacterium]
MSRILKINILLLIVSGALLPSCQKNYGNLNNPTVEDFLNNASSSQLNNLVNGTESAMRNNIGLYLDDVGVIGREIYRFSGADPRYTTDLLGASDATLNNTGFYITNTWNDKYRVIKNCNLLIQAAENSRLITDADKKGYTGFAKTIKAYELLLTLDLTWDNGIRVDVTDPNKLGPVLDHTAALAAIAILLDDGKTDLSAADISFSLSSGFSGFKDSGGLTKFNRALAARVAVYRAKWDDALDYLNESFFDLNGNFESGIFHVFGNGSGDQLNSAFFPQNQAGEVRIAHPSYAADIEPGDDRIGKATLRSSPASNTGLSGNRDVWVYTSSTAPVPVIRNEELILIYAEANIQKSAFPDAVNAINIIRHAHNLPSYSGALTMPALTDEMLKQRRYSLFFEGHRWVDLRRYGKLDELTVDRSGDDVWSSFPLPSTEQ